MLLIPIFDTLRVLIVRLLNGKNPFRADNLQLHYLFVQRNISPAKVTLMFWSLTAAFGVIALALANRTSLPYLAVVLSALSFLSLFAANLAQRDQPVKEGQPAEQFQTGIGTDSLGLILYDNASPVFTSIGKMILTLKLIVVFGFLFLAVQVVASETSARNTPMEKQLHGLGIDMARN